MLLTISTTREPATDLGFLLHKHPARVQEFDLAFGRAHVFYPEASPLRCIAALLLDVDPIALVRGRHGGGRIPRVHSDSTSTTDPMWLRRS
jgi:RNA repair, ligase-Pnkp-associating, region of Hen1